MQLVISSHNFDSYLPARFLRAFVPMIPMILKSVPCLGRTAHSAYLSGGFPGITFTRLGSKMRFIRWNLLKLRLSQPLFMTLSRIRITRSFYSFLLFSKILQVTVTVKSVIQVLDRSGISRFPKEISKNC